MSDTDDTDVLLLIPPNFFEVPGFTSDESLLQTSRTVVHKPKQSCTAKVLGKLVDHVSLIEDRLENLELNASLSNLSLASKTLSTTSFNNRHYTDQKYYTYPRRRRKKVVNKQRVSLTSISSVNQEVPPLKLNTAEKYTGHLNEKKIMDDDISSIVSSPCKKNDKLLLNEIDEFLTKVEAYESPDKKYNKELCDGESIIKATGDYISQKLEANDNQVTLPSGRVVSSGVLDKYIYLVNSKPASQSDKSSVSFCKNDDTSKYNLETSKLNVKHNETTSHGARKLNFEDSKVQTTSTPKKLALSISDSGESFRPSSNKIYNRAAKILEQYKTQNSSKTESAANNSTAKKDFKMPQMRPYGTDYKEIMKVINQNKFLETVDTDLLSLSELWGDNNDKIEKGDSLKLEEEKLKREHCEAMIQQLQKKLLEQQEKLAVAVKVDRSKDVAISKLREAWLRLTGSLDRAEERHRLALHRMMNEVDNFKMVAEDAHKKTGHFETELYKALDLAHDYQEKCKKINEEKKELLERLDRIIIEKDDIIKCRDKEVEVLKDNYETVMRLNKQSTDCIKNLEEALEKEKREHSSTKNTIRELNGKIKCALDESNLVKQERDLLKLKVNEERSRANILEKQLCDKQNECVESLKRCDNLENEVKSLRRHLELQKGELKAHYQQQLETAVVCKLQEFQAQLDEAQRQLENEARSREAALLDTYNQQLCGVEKQHKLEINLIEEKHKEEIKLCRLQLVQATEKIAVLECKLESLRKRRTEIASQLHGVMEAQWRQALHILTNGHQQASSLDLTRHSVSTPTYQDLSNVSSTCPVSLGKTSSKNQDSRFEGRKKEENVDALSDIELQRYVKLFLSKPVQVQDTGSEKENKMDNSKQEEPTSDRADRMDKSKRSLNTKPPWKA